MALRISDRARGARHPTRCLISCGSSYHLVRSPILGRLGQRSDFGSASTRSHRKTGISVAAGAQLAMVTPHMPFEFLPAELCESRLRKELVRDELVFDGGALEFFRRGGPGG